MLINVKSQHLKMKKKQIPIITILLVLIMVQGVTVVSLPTDYNEGERSMSNINPFVLMSTFML